MAAPSETPGSQEIIPASPTTEPPTATPEPYLTPEGYVEYRDPLTSISIHIPADWTVTGVHEGEYAILQSYPEDKYIGGERREPGDSKCDLNLDPQLAGEDELIQQWNNSDITTILSVSTITLAAGQEASLYELDSLGRANVVVAQFDSQMVLLTCFGDFTNFKTIAESLTLVQ
jgi:hypothetical protein